MRVSFSVLSISLLLVCIWFAHASVKKIKHHRKVLIAIMWIAILMFCDHIFGILMEEGVIPLTDKLLYLERAVHFITTIEIYSLYAFFLYCIVDHFQYQPRWKKLVFFAPSWIVYILILTTWWTGLVFHVQDGKYYGGPLFLSIFIIRDIYGIAATIRAIRRIRILPKVFGRCVALMTAFSLIQLAILFATHNEFSYYSSMIVNIVTFLLATTVVEFYKDPQTDLLNRQAFTEYVDKEIEKKFNKKVYLIKLKNYEYFKENCHDVLLQKMINQLSDCIKENAMISATYYLGSGRFSIVVCKNDKFNEQDFLEKLDTRVRMPFEINGARFEIKLFVSIINLEKNEITRENFYRYFSACDDMRYRNDNHLEVIEGDSFGIDQIQRYRSVEEAIDRAIVEKEFAIHYQPIIDSKTGKVISAEALIRLNDRVIGFVSPDEFIPISENNGKIIDISEFVIDSVFRFAKECDFEGTGLEFIEMNLSVMQCMDKNLCEKLQYYIMKHGIEPKRINLEITETATNFDEKRLKEQLEKIRKLGFSFSLDDYGTGYSNLVRVLEYPVDVIKLDKTIIWSAFHDKDNFVTLRNLISMFHDVRRKIVAEGVESEAQKKALEEMGCDYLQGFYYSKPLTGTAFMAFVEKTNRVK